MKKILYLSLITILLPSIVLAGGSEDDRVYTTTYEQGYTYGNVKDCNTSSGIAWFEGIETASGYKVCLWNVKDKVGTDRFKCEDSSMERFTLGKVTDNHGTEYWGYGCRKADPSKIEYIKKTLYVGYGEQVASQYSNKCTILEGDAVQFNKHNACWVDAVKAGKAKVKVVNNDNQTASYYEYEVIKGTQKVSELDDKYVYGSVDKCHLGSKGYTYGGTVTFDGLTFCGSSAAGYNYESYEISCKDEGYDTFKLTFDSNGTHYKGYGCRKIKQEEKIEYVKKQLYLGYGAQLAYEHTHKCTILEGNSVQINKWNSCYIDAVKVGTSKVKVVSEETGMATYYEYEVISPTSSIDELDDKYRYGSVDKCRLGEKGYTYGGKVGFQGYTFCGSKAAGYNFEKYEVTCLNSKYELFTLTFKSDEGTTYKGYGCRCEKGTDCDTILPEPEVITQTCDSLLGSPNTKGSPAFYLATVFSVLRYVAIAIIIVMTTLDFVGAVSSHDNEIIKKAVNKLLKRAILCVIIFLLPTVIEFILQFVHNRSITTCGIGG